MKDPEATPGILREGIARPYNAVSVEVPTNSEDARNKMNEGLGRIPQNLVRLVDSVTSIVGIRGGRYCGLVSTTERFNPPKGKEFEYRVRAIVTQPGRGIADVLECASNLIGDIVKPGVQAVNLGMVLPLSSNNVNVDAWTDVVKGPLRAGLYLGQEMAGVGLPASWKSSVFGMKKWAGFDLSEEDERTHQELQMKFKRLYEGEIKPDIARVIVNAIPAVGNSLDSLFWRTNVRGNSGTYQIVVNFMENGIPAPVHVGDESFADDKKWYGKDKDPTKAPGVFINNEFRPAKSVLLELIKLAPSFAGSGGGGGGGASPASGGGRSGGSGGR